MAMFSRRGSAINAASNCKYNTHDFMKRNIITLLAVVSIVSVVHATTLAEYQAVQHEFEDAQATYLDTKTANDNLLKTCTDVTEIKRSREAVWAALQRFNQLTTKLRQTADPVEIQQQNAQIAANVKADYDRHQDQMRRMNEESRAEEVQRQKEERDNQEQERIANAKAQVEIDAARDADYVRDDNNTTGVLTRLGLKVPSENKSQTRPLQKAKERVWLANYYSTHPQP
jgi:hypothetical protein